MVLINTEKRFIYGHLMKGRTHATKDDGKPYCSLPIKNYFVLFEGGWKEVDCKLCLDRRSKQKRIAEAERKILNAKKDKQVLQEERSIIDEIIRVETDTKLGVRLVGQGGWNERLPDSTTKEHGCQ